MEHYKMTRADAGHFEAHARRWERTSKSLSGSNTLRGHHENKTRATARRNDPDPDPDIDSDWEGEKTFGMGLQRNE